MYETPKLNRVGKAEEVILGYMPTGDDIDTFFCENVMDFAEESENPGAISA